MCHHISIVLPNRPGELRQVAAHLAQHDINVLGHQLASQGNSCAVHLLCDRHAEAFEVLRREYKFYCNEKPVIIIALPHKPGELRSILEAIASHDLNIESSYQGVGHDDSILLIIELRDREATREAETALRAANLAVLAGQP